MQNLLIRGEKVGRIYKNKALHNFEVSNDLNSELSVATTNKGTKEY